MFSVELFCMKERESEHGHTLQFSVPGSHAWSLFDLGMGDRGKDQEQSCRGVLLERFITGRFVRCLHVGARVNSRGCVTYTQPEGQAFSTDSLSIA